MCVDISLRQSRLVSLAAVQGAMLAGLPYTGLCDAILAHPMMAEGLGVLLSGVPAITDTRRARVASRLRLTGAQAAPLTHLAQISLHRCV
jgi:hypothetical protein